MAGKIATSSPTASPMAGSAGPAPWTTARSVGAIASLLLGVAPVLLLGLEWGAACLSLGRPPVPSLDDPKSISLLSSVLHTLTGLSFVSLVVMPFSLPVIWWKKASDTPQANLIALGCFVLPIASIFILNQDPLSIVSWWFD